MSEEKKVQSAHLTYHEKRKFHAERLEEMKIVANAAGTPCSSNFQR